MDRKKLLIIAGAVIVLLLIIFGVVYFLTRKTTPTTPTPVCDPTKDPTCSQTTTPVNGAATLNIWGVFDDNTTFTPLIAEFNKQYPNIQITFTKKQYSDYESSLVDQIAAGGGPDIFAVNNYWIPKDRAKMVAAPDAILSIDEFNQNFIPAVYNDFVMDNKIYGLPLYSDNLALYYNKKMFNQANIYDPPKSWNDVLTYNKLLTKKVTGNPQAIDVAGIALGTSNNVTRSSDILLALMMQNGTPIISADKRTFEFNQFLKDVEGNPQYPGTKALEFYTAFSDSNNGSYSWNSTFNDSINAFANEKVAMILGYSYFGPSIEKINPQISYGIAPLPQIVGSQNNVTVANYWGWSVSRNSKYPNEAWTFLKFLSEKENNISYLQATSLPSAQKNITGGANKVFEDQKSYAQTIFKGDDEALDQIFNEMIDDVVKYKQPTQTSIDSAARKANEMLTKYY